MSKVRNLAMAAIVTGLLAAASPAGAAGTITCFGAATEDPVRVEINVGQLPALVPLWMRIAIGGETWSTLEGEGSPVAILQAFDDSGTFSVDLSDPNVERILFSLRLVRAEAGRETAQAGVLLASGEGREPVGAYALFCEGP